MRLIDLHTDWLLQYAPESTLFDPALYPWMPQRLPQSDGYLDGTSAAFLSCYRVADDWARQPDRWSALGALLARYEAEFSGRLLYGTADLVRWSDDPDGLCWGLIGIEGFDSLVREPGDLDRLPRLFERGVRLFQPVHAADNLLAGSAVAGDDRGLTDLGRACLQTLFDLGPATAGPRPLLDLAHLNPFAAAEALEWFEADAARPRRVIPVYSHGALSHDAFRSPRAISAENLRRLRSIGGVVGFSVGPPFYTDAQALRAGIEAAAALPFQGRAGIEGIAIGTDFLGVDQVLPELGDADAVVAWLGATFDPATAYALIQGNARSLLERALGLENSPRS